MSTHEFPAFVYSLPEADLPYSELKGWLMTGGNGQVLYCESEAEILIPEHSHGEQWGCVIKGRMELTIQDRTHIYARGELFHIPSGAKHRVHIFPGFRAVQHSENVNHYFVKKRH